MEIRRLQKIKGGSFTLSLPKRWVEKRKLKSGEQMAVLEEEDGSIRIFPVEMPLEKPLEVTLKLEDYPTLRALEYSVGTYYIQGSNKITIFSKETISAEHKKRIKLLRMELPGMEVAQEEANKLSFQVLIDPSIFSLESLIEKTSSFSLHLQEDAVKSLLEYDFQLAAEAIERSKEAMRHYRMTIRQVALASLSKSIAKKVGVKSCRECITFALVARDLNRVVYHSSSIAEHILTLKQQKKKIDKDILNIIVEMSTVAYEMQQISAQAFLKKDVRLAILAMGKMEKIRGKEKTLLTKVIEETKNVDTAVILGMIARDLRRIAGYAVAIADDAMNRVLTPVAD
jgi:phosphate uptake regulator